MGCKVFGRREGVPYYVVPTAGIEDQVFCMVDSTATSPRGIKVATAGASVLDGVVGVVQTGIWHGHYGTSADKYPQAADINVVSNGQVRVKILQTTSTESDYLVDGDLVTIGTGGKAAKYVAPTGSISDPTMTATLGETAIGTTISGATATIGDAAMGTIISGATATLTADHPTAAEIKAFLAEVLPAYNAAEAVKTKAYLTEILPKYAGLHATAEKAYIKEWVGDYVAAYNTGVDVAKGKVVGRCIGAPVGGVVAIELIGLGGIQQG